MCGIAGYVGTAPPEDRRVYACLKLMRRRGPDAQRSQRYHFRYNQQVVLLHSRLSIIDTAPHGVQPMSFDGCHIAFNGELYNYKELRAELEAVGEFFDHDTDTEVLLRLLARRGADALDACEGMWAFVFLDESRQELILSRDRFAEKPLYTYLDSSGLYFASEPKLIFALLGRSLPVNKKHVTRFLVNGYKSLYKTRDTFFEGLNELASGACMVYRAPDDTQVSQYWTPRFEQNPSMDAMEAAQGVREALIRSVELRLRSDVPLAFCMSGGIDSNTIISIAKRLCDYDVHGFTVVNTDARYEEQTQVRHMVYTLGLRHTEVPVDSRDFISQLTELVRYHDAPVYTISYYLHWQMMQRMHELGYKVSISGTAADELFTGYYDHHCFYLASAGADDKRALDAWREHIKFIVRNPYLQSPELFAANPGLREHIYLNRDAFANMLLVPAIEDFFEERFTDDVLRNRLANEMFREVVPVILHEDDLNAMYYSIENRSPFLDRALFEFSQRIPTKHLIRDGYAKVVLRDAMSGVVPDEILWNRRKVGFNAPIADLLQPHDPATQAWLLADSPLFEILDRNALAGCLDQEFIPNSYSKFLFYVSGVKIFLEAFS